jgi:hypothetical protein
MLYETPTFDRGPPKPDDGNFGLVVLLAGVAFIIMFLCAYLVLYIGGKRLLPQREKLHRTSYMVPAPSKTMDA